MKKKDILLVLGLVGLLWSWEGGRRGRVRSLAEMPVVASARGEFVEVERGWGRLMGGVSGWWGGLGEDGRTHEVKSGETLTGIARAYGMEVEELAALNRIEDVDRISAGQVLRVR